MKDCCPFCRMSYPRSGKEIIKRIKRRMKMYDPGGIYALGTHYHLGEFGLPQSTKKAIELWRRAAELGHLEAHKTIGTLYLEGVGVEKDRERAVYHWELAAIGGHENARYNLGINEIDKWRHKEDSNTMYRAMKHFTISARAGCDKSLRYVGIGYATKDGIITKDEYATTLRAHKDSIDEMKSEQRDKDAATLMTNMATKV